MQAALHQHAGAAEFHRLANLVVDRFEIEDVSLFSFGSLQWTIKRAERAVFRKERSDSFAVYLAEERNDKETNSAAEGKCTQKLFTRVLQGSGSDQERHHGKRGRQKGRYGNCPEAPAFETLVELLSLPPWKFSF